MHRVSRKYINKNKIVFNSRYKISLIKEDLIKEAKLVDHNIILVHENIMLEDNHTITYYNIPENGSIWFGTLLDFMEEFGTHIILEFRGENAAYSMNIPEKILIKCNDRISRIRFLLGGIHKWISTIQFKNNKGKELLDDQSVEECGLVDHKIIYFQTTRFVVVKGSKSRRKNVVKSSSEVPENGEEYSTTMAYFLSPIIEHSRHHLSRENPMISDVLNSDISPKSKELYLNIISKGNEAIEDIDKFVKNPSTEKSGNPLFDDHGAELVTRREWLKINDEVNEKLMQFCELQPEFLQLNAMFQSMVSVDMQNADLDEKCMDVSADKMCLELLNEMIKNKSSEGMPPELMTSNKRKPTDLKTTTQLGSLDKSKATETNKHLPRGAAACETVKQEICDSNRNQLDAFNNKNEELNRIEKIANEFVNKPEYWDVTSIDLNSFTNELVKTMQAEGYECEVLSLKIGNRKKEFNVHSNDLADEPSLNSRETYSKFVPKMSDLNTMANDVFTTMAKFAEMSIDLTINPSTNQEAPVTILSSFPVTVADVKQVVLNGDNFKKLYLGQENFQNIYQDGDVLPSGSSVSAISLSEFNYFELDKFLGSGAYGEVGIYTNTLNNEKRVLKKIMNKNVNLHELKEVIREIVTFSKTASHSRIIRYFNYYYDDSYYYIEMECMKESLRDYLNIHGSLQEDGIKHFSYQILQGLNYLHDKLILHSDIKPDNVLLDENKNAKLTDFGLAKVFYESSEKFQEGMKLSAGGFDLYLAPEIQSEEFNYTFGAPADIWAFGVTVLEMVTGKEILYEFEDLKAVAYQMMESNSDQMKNVIILVDCCLKNNPKDRLTCFQLRELDFLRDD